MKKIISLLLSAFMCFAFFISGSCVKITQENYQVLCEKLSAREEKPKSVSADIAVSNSAPTVNAKAVCLMDKGSGQVLYCENENEKLYPASVTKIMTLLLVCEAIETGKIAMADNVQVSENAASKGGSQIWLKPNEVMSVDDLLKAAAVYSANDACTALGEYVSGSEDAFISLMNDRAKELGMNNTHFENCTGLDDTTETHLTTAFDIAIMSRELLNYDIIKKYSTIWMDTLRNGATELVNTNKLVRFYEGCTGLKTGTTSKAGCCVSATAERNGMELIAVVLGAGNSNDRFNSARSMLDWGFANYETVTPEIDKSLITEVKIIKGVCESVKPKLPEISSVLIKKGDRDKINYKVQLSDTVEAPVEFNQVLGKVQVLFGEEVLSEYNLICEKEIGKMKFFDAMKKIFDTFTKN